VTKYAVWSTHVSFDRELNIPPRDVLEVTRTDRKVAELDVAIIKDILHRKSWIQEESMP
jgi:hypothetical protein